MEGNESVWVDAAQSQVIGERIRRLALPRHDMGVFLGGQPALSTRRLIDYYFYLNSLLFDFRGFDIVIDDQDLHGADAFFTLSRRQAERDPEWFTAGRLATVTEADVQSLYSVSGDPAECAIPRPAERADLLRDAAERLLRDHRGEAANLLETTEGRLRREDGKGLAELLGEYAGYRDPHFKKGFMLVKTLETLGLYRVLDRENLFIPVDYHLMRVALRAGMIEVSPTVGAHLRTRRPASDELDEEIRGAVKLAYKIVEEQSGLDIFGMDELFWTLGRSCCHYSRPPRCHACDFTRCTVMRSFEYQCPGLCPLSGVCRGSGDVVYSSLYETQVTTVFY